MTTNRTSTMNRVGLCLSSLAALCVVACSLSPTPTFGLPCQTSTECGDEGVCRVGPLDDVLRCLPERTPDEPGDTCDKPVRARVPASPSRLVDQRIAFAGARDDVDVACSAAGLADVVVRFTVPPSSTPQPGIRISTDNPRVALSLRQSTDGACTEIARDGCAAIGEPLLLEAIAPGDYEIVVDGLPAGGVDEVATQLIVERLACPPAALPFDEGRCVRTAPVQALGTAREHHEVVRLADGTIVAVGGFDGLQRRDDFEALDASTQRWRYGSLNVTRVDPAVAVLPTDDLLVLGGEIDEAELVDFRTTNGESKFNDDFEIDGFFAAEGRHWFAAIAAGRVIVLNDGDAPMGIIETRRVVRTCRDSLTCEVGEACIETQETSTATSTVCLCIAPEGCGGTADQLQKLTPGRIATRHGVAVVNDTTVVMAVDNDVAERGVIDKLAVVDARRRAPVIVDVKTTVFRKRPTLFALDDQRVLIAGGVDANDQPIDVVEIFDVPRQTVSTVAWRLPRPIAAPQFRLLGGQVLMLPDDGTTDAWFLSIETGRLQRAPAVLARTGGESVSDGDDSVVIIGGRIDGAVTRLVERLELVAADIGPLPSPVDCAAAPLATGAISGNSSSATDTFRSSVCAGNSIVAGHDNTFTFTIDEPRSLRVFDFEEPGSAFAGPVHNLYLMRGTCGDWTEIVCGDAGQSIALFAGRLEPDTYTLIVEYAGTFIDDFDTFEGTAWQANVLIDAPAECVVDANDPIDDDVAGAQWLATEVDGVALKSGTLCPGDFDHLIFEHWGGPSSIDVSGLPSGTIELKRAVIDVAASVAVGHPVASGVSGPAILDFDDLADADPGLYVVRLAAATTNDFGSWELASHQDCAADVGDSQILELDNAAFDRAFVLQPGERVTSSSCQRTDRELYILTGTPDRPTSVTLDHEPADLRIELFAIDGDRLGAPLPFNAVQSNLASTSIDFAAFPGRLALRVGFALEGAPFVDDTISIDFQQVQPGDSCLIPLDLVSDDETTGTLTGDTTGFNDDHNAQVVGECTGYRSPGADVVYRVHLETDQTIALSTVFSGAIDDAALYILSGCDVVETACVAGADLQGGGSTPEVLEFTNNGAAADFFVVIDSFYGDPFQWALQWSIGDAP